MSANRIKSDSAAAYVAGLTDEEIMRRPRIPLPEPGLILATLFYAVIFAAFIYGATDGRGTITKSIHDAMLAEEAANEH